LRTIVEECPSADGHQSSDCPEEVLSASEDNCLDDNCMDDDAPEDFEALNDFINQGISTDEVKYSGF
jgi:hypothetical protein